MTPGDARSRAVAVLPDCLVNAGAERYAPLGLTDLGVLDLVLDAGYGLLVLPSHLAADPETGQGVTTVAREAVDYHRHGYTVVELDIAEVQDGAVWRTRLHRELERWAVPTLPALTISPHGFAPAAVQAFLAEHRGPLPEGC
ncbi:MAG TPA: hypothetical protein VGC67_10850 [Cellulomonas sp.]